MERISPLFILFLVYLFIGLISKGKKPTRNNNRQAAGKPVKPVRPAAQAPRPEAPRQPSAEKPKQPAAAKRASVPEAPYIPHRGADGTLHPTEHQPHAAAAPSLLTIHGDLAEGSDPCHEYMLDDPVLPECEDLNAGEPAETPSLPLSFTRDSMVNAVVMSEILNRRTPQGRPAART